MAKRKRKEESAFHIALIGGNSQSAKLLAKQARNPFHAQADARIVAVVDPNMKSPGMKCARKLGVKTFTDFRRLFDPAEDIHLIVTLDANHTALEEICRQESARIPVIPYEALHRFCRAVGQDERKLKERTDEIETILNGIQDFILVINPSMEIVEVNQPFLTQMGYTREEVLGRKCHEVHQRVQQQCNGNEIVCPLNQAIRNKAPSQQVLTRVDHDGEQRHIEVTLFPIWENDGKISKFIEISRDITERITREEKTRRVLAEMVERRTRQLEETHAKLLHQDKMASLGKLSASVVHEINNPIAGILNLNLLIQRLMGTSPPKTQEAEQIRRYLTLMETETRRISRIVSNLLAFSRQSKMEVGRIHLPRLIDKTLMINTNLLSLHGIKVEQRIEPDLPEVIGSEDQLQQVFMNIISNAAEAMEGKGGGTLKIAARPDAENGTLEVRLSDTGVGIRPGDLGRLFEPFYTTKKKGKGVGLGLSVAYGIIQDHGGSIRVDSTPGKGTAFTVCLPLTPPEDRRNPPEKING